MQKKKILIIDPPEGWKYGFPKPAPEGLGNLRQWFKDQGYPEHMIPMAMQHSRYWEVEGDENV